jgi:hypothetical protein
MANPMSKDVYYWIVRAIADYAGDTMTSASPILEVFENLFDAAGDVVDSPEEAAEDVNEADRAANNGSFEYSIDSALDDINKFIDTDIAKALKSFVK